MAKKSNNKPKSKGTAAASTKAKQPALKKKHAAREQRKALMEQQKSRIQAPDPFSKENLKKLGLRLGIGAAVVWGIAIAIPGTVSKVVAGVVTVAVLGAVAWAMRFATKSRQVADIVRGADTAEGRKEALEKLDADFKTGDTAATFAKAQLLMQDSPREALSVLEGIDLKKVMAPLADEARSQRAMIHLMLGETDKARVLADGIDLTRHKEAKIRATLAAIVGEAWARTGQSRRAIDLLETFDPDEADYKDIAPQLYRSRAFAYSWSNQSKKMKATLRKLRSINPQLLMGFITKKKNPAGVNPKGVHPALEKAAYNMVMQSGAVPRKMQVRRMR